jgi:micrococcal nuclease
MNIVLRIILVLLVVFFGSQKDTFSSFNKNFAKSYYFEHCIVAKESSKDSPLHVVQVVDGDTIQVSKDCKPVTVRLIGINTPETVDPRRTVECFGHEASNRAKEILSNVDVKIETDPSQDTYDKYGRLLGYVIMQDGTNFNQKMIAEGYAYEYTYNTPYRYQKEFKEAQKSAQKEDLGLWAKNTCDGKK